MRKHKPSTCTTMTYGILIWLLKGFFIVESEANKAHKLFSISTKSVTVMGNSSEREKEIELIR